MDLYVWLLTPELDRATWPFLKNDIRHGAYQYDQKE